MRYLTLALGLVFCFLAATVQPGDAVDSAVMPGDTARYITAEAALERAFAYTGFDKVTGFDKAKVDRPEKVRMVDDKTPFIATALINGRDVWRVVFKNVAVGDSNHMVKRDFDVLMDPRTGNLLRIYSVSDEVGSSDTLAELSAADADQDLRDRRCVFNGLPAGPPPVSFVQAVANCYLSPAKAKVIRAMYLDYSSSQKRRPNIWVLILRGTERPIPMSSPGGDKVPVRERNSLWVAVDAIKGYMLYFRDAQ